MYIGNNCHITLWLTMMQGQQSLTLSRSLFSRWGREHFAFCFSYEGCQYFIFDGVQSVTPKITQGTRPTIIDTHVMGGAEWVLESGLPRKVADNTFMNVYNQLVV